MDSNQLCLTIIFRANALYKSYLDCILYFLNDINALSLFLAASPLLIILKVFAVHIFWKIVNGKENSFRVKNIVFILLRGQAILWKRFANQNWVLNSLRKVKIELRRNSEFGNLRWLVRSYKVGEVFGVPRYPGKSRKVTRKDPTLHKEKMLALIFLFSEILKYYRIITGMFYFEHFHAVNYPSR